MDQKFLIDFAPAADGQPFQLVMIRAMIAAAKADGHIDALTQPVDLNAIASAARGIEQATELYLVSRMVIDPDHPAERAYLEALGYKLNLPQELVAHLNHQVEATNT